MPAGVVAHRPAMRRDYAVLGPHVWVRREQFNRFRPDDLPASFQAAIEKLWPGTLAEPLRWG